MIEIGRHKSLLTGIALGAVAGLLTWRFDNLLAGALDARVWLVRGLYTVAQALVLPGMLSAIVIGRGSNSFELWQAIAINACFWFGFAWLFGTLLGMLRSQWQTLMTQVRR